jgi:hypothetical protein
MSPNRYGDLDHIIMLGHVLYTYVAIMHTARHMHTVFTNCTLWTRDVMQRVSLRCGKLGPLFMVPGGLLIIRVYVPSLLASFA